MTGAAYWIRKLLYAVAAGIILMPAAGGVVQALSQDDINSIYNDTVWYQTDNGAGSTTAGCTTVDFGAGSLPSSIPEPANGIFTAAATKFKVPVALVVAIYLVENNGKQGTDPTTYVWRVPPAPYGNGSPWRVSSAGAKGPFQFLDGTWGSQGQDGNGDGVKDVLDLTDAAFGAANYLSYLLSKANGNIKLAAGGYEAGHPVQSEYGDDAYALYQYYLNGSVESGGGTTSPGACGSGAAGVYMNPLRDVPNAAQAGIDPGVDYSGDGPVYALGDGKVVYSSLDTPTHWVGGNAIAYTLSDGPAAGRTVYVAENCTPRVRTNDQVTSTTVLCDMHNVYPFIETGWAQTGTDVPWAYTDNCYYLVNPSQYPNKTSTAYGVNFDALMNKLGAPKASLLAPPITCTLQHGSWPDW